MDIKETLDRQRAFFLTGQTLDVRYRYAILKLLRSSILEMQDEIVEALRLDLGKSATESYMCEIGMALSSVNDAIRNVRRRSAKKHVPSPLSQFPSRSYIVPEPYGNVLIMSPWNYPFLLCISPLVSALSAGNTAVIKPSAYAPASSAVIRKLIDSTFTEDYVCVIEGGREANAELLEQKWDYIFFTGSKAVGRLVMEKAAAHLTPVTLELGGKSPVIVDERCDLEMAATRTVFGKYLNLGQTCVAPDHVFIHSSVADRFISLCKDKIGEMYGEDPLSNRDYGKIISKKHFTRLTGLLDDCREKICFGGVANDSELRISPAIADLGDIHDGFKSFKVMQEEIFGPVLPVIRYDSIQDVVSVIQAMEKPLATYIFTNDREMKDYLLSTLHFGGGCINDTIIHLASEKMPFGGVGESGMGRYHGKYGFETFSHYKSIVEKGTWLDIKMRYQPYSDKKYNLIRKFLK